MILSTRLSALLTVAALLVACGGGPAVSDEGTQPSPTGEPTAPAAEEASAPASTPPQGTPMNADETAPTASDLPADGADKRTLPSGIMVSTLAAGAKDGSPPMPGDQVTVHYTGWLTNGSKFDSSRDRNEPTSFAIGPGLIEGWNLALVNMVPGDRWKVTIPPEHAYGPGGKPPVIPPSATLVFDIELLSVKAAPRFTAPDPEQQKTLESGVKVQVLEEGDGPSPVAGDTIVFHFALFTTDGVLVQSTHEAPEPPMAPLDKMPMPFLKEVPTLMKKGATWLCEVPSEQAMGDKGMGPMLPPGATSIWKIELLDVGKPLALPEFVKPAEDALETSPSGLRWQVLAPGEGEAPTWGDRVEVHYAGWLEDGTVFDSSYGRGFPARFEVGKVIPGWNEGLRKLAPGGEAILVIPPKLAYGNRGTGNIPPNSTLVFKVKLLQVNPAE